ncbi:hypothetical protein KJS94_09450 [Flavihumibacter rivuli]|uniref:hypothetical protein n=1 Tax=Flavihumibacter rivuli TaxID=2838156 RepID=UPI001BDEEAA2|nr:hypothetical protein [Flavihumibacter rivuli]ULQ58420.1 hypothetical protein KJS94_09450 [Flavihumibacter rivuli]
MPCHPKVEGCMPCHEERKPSRGKKKGLGLFSGIILAVLPKCPFCFVAFSSTLVLCGKGETIDRSITHSSTPTILFASVFSLLAIVSIALSYKDSRTRYALLAAIGGAACVLTSVLLTGGEPLYYIGVLMIMGAVAINMRRFRLLERMNDWFRGRTMKKLA